jgi:aspartyl-tRNA synthetase
MSYVVEEDVMATVEEMVTAVSREVVPERPIATTPFPRLTYDEALARFGSDKPDVRFGMELVDLREALAGTDLRVFTEALAAGGAVHGIVAQGCAGYSRRQTDELTEIAVRHGAAGLVHLAVEPDGSLRGPVARHLPPATQEAVREVSGAKPGDLVLAVADADPHRGAEALGRVRVELGTQLDLRTPDVLSYVWVHRFPMFQWDVAGNRWDATHNPFSAPVWDQADDLERDPASIQAQQYDLALNGWELGGGSIRIHRRDLLDALEYGAPPHGGIAIGLDRWAALLTYQDNIREVMAFPKTQSGSDLMLGAPSPIDPAQLDELGLRLAETDPQPSEGS